jgi:hypothetical protein
MLTLQFVNTWRTKERAGDNLTVERSLNHRLRVCPRSRKIEGVSTVKENWGCVHGQGKLRVCPRSRKTEGVSTVKEKWGCVHGQGKLRVYPRSRKTEGVSTINENWGRRIRLPGMECSREYRGPTVTDSWQRSVFQLGFGLKAKSWRVRNCYTLSRTVRVL